MANTIAENAGRQAGAAAQRFQEGASEVAQSASSTLDETRKTAQDVGQRAADALRDASSRAQEVVGDVGEQVRRGASSLEDALEQVTSEHPKMMLGFALAAGFALGALYWGSRPRHY